MARILENIYKLFNRKQQLYLSKIFGQIQRSLKDFPPLCHRANIYLRWLENLFLCFLNLIVEELKVLFVKWLAHLALKYSIVSGSQVWPAPGLVWSAPGLVRSV